MDASEAEYLGCTLTRPWAPPSFLPGRLPCLAAPIAHAHAQAHAHSRPSLKWKALALGTAGRHGSGTVGTSPTSFPPICAQYLGTPSSRSFAAAAPVPPSIVSALLQTSINFLSHSSLAPRRELQFPEGVGASFALAVWSIVPVSDKRLALLLCPPESDKAVAAVSEKGPPAFGSRTPNQVITTAASLSAHLVG
ncbi:hypothetical protein CEP52_003465 [Fusarium oligoseptatum]|uniref:Uncharacterized protein n=1 Tax=Fusarium oligoseptatum TaxID=2604345 RepID=A0A428U8J1_9HYPO|nr:hypothetical protein CEP52_003465 [Fusarium oligoseptatum]